MKGYITITVACGLLALPAHAEPRYKLNKQMTAAVALSNLSPGGDPCLPDRATGRIVAVKYNEMQTLPIAFTIEGKNGERMLINVDVDEFLNSSRLAQGWVGQALQKIESGGAKTYHGSGGIVPLRAV